MGRPRAAWLTALGLLGVGWVTAHVLSYMLVVPDAGGRRELLLQSGHGYFRAADLLILCVTIALSGLAVYIVGGGHRRSQAPNPRMLALLPPIGFVVQEHLERLAAGGAFPTELVAEPRFWLGLLLQLPFALAALLCAGALIVAAGRLARTLAARTPQIVPVVWLGSVLPPFPDLPRRSALASGYSERGPPLSISG